jgi:hypothetical protein
MKTKVVIDDLRRLVYKYVRDYEIKDLMEEYLEEIEDAVTPSPQIEVELENILDVCAFSDANYGRVLASVNTIRKELYGD